VTSSGKLFQSLAPAIGKARLPTVGSHLREMDETIHKMHQNAEISTLDFKTFWSLIMQRVKASPHPHVASKGKNRKTAVAIDCAQE